jgi:hypothetical protein
MNIYKKSMFLLPYHTFPSLLASVTVLKMKIKIREFFIEFLEINPSLTVSGMNTRCEIESFEGEE